MRKQVEQALAADNRAALSVMHGGRGGSKLRIAVGESDMPRACYDSSWIRPIAVGTPATPRRRSVPAHGGDFDDS